MCPSRSSRTPRTLRSLCSRRNFLRAFGGSVCAVTAGCFDQLLRNAANTHKKSVTESNSEHTVKSFRTHVERMNEQYGEYGVWGKRKPRQVNGGITGTDTKGSLSFVGAWSDGWTLRKPKTAAKNEGQLRISIDYAVVLYRVRGPDDQGRPIHRVWLWSATRPEQSDENHGRTKLVELSMGVTLDGSGEIDRYAPGTSYKPSDAPIRIGLSNSTKPTARFPLPAGRIKPSPDTTTDSGGMFAVEWSGGHGATISVAGVCEIRRDPNREYEFTLTNEASGTQGTL